MEKNGRRLQSDLRIEIVEKENTYQRRSELPYETSEQTDKRWQLRLVNGGRWFYWFKCLTLRRR